MTILELLKQGKQRLVEGNFAEALSYFEQASLIEPNNSDILNQKGAALRSLGKFDEALECFNRALELDPRDRFSS